MIWIIFILGLLIGSFLNVCIYRIPKKESIILPPSHCVSCDTKLQPLDLVPIFSYLFYRGKCRYCGEGISPQYPIVELISGLIFILLFWRFGLGFSFIRYGILSSLLIIITFIDFNYQIIPDRLIVFGFIIEFALKLIQMELGFFINGALGLVMGGGLFLLIAVASKGAMGGGDIKLMAMLGFIFGIRYILLISFLSFIIGAIVSIFLLILKIKGRKDYIPFGPFIALATILAIFYGDKIIDWYFIKIIV